MLNHSGDERILGGRDTARASCLLSDSMSFGSFYALHFSVSARKLGSCLIAQCVCVRVAKIALVCAARIGNIQTSPTIKSQGILSPRFVATSFIPALHTRQGRFHRRLHHDFDLSCVALS